MQNSAATCNLTVQDLSSCASLRHLLDSIRKRRGGLEMHRKWDKLRKLSKHKWNGKTTTQHAVFIVYDRHGSKPYHRRRKQKPHVAKRPLPTQLREEWKSQRRIIRSTPSSETYLILTVAERRGIKEMFRRRVGIRSSGNNKKEEGKHKSDFEVECIDLEFCWKGGKNNR